MRSSRPTARSTDDLHVSNGDGPRAGRGSLHARGAARSRSSAGSSVGGEPAPPVAGTVRGRADPPRPQPGSRRRVHVLGPRSGRVDTRGFEFEHVLADIQSLNEWALEGQLEVTALSLHAYPFVQDRYVLLPHGASMGSGYGPGRRRARDDDAGGPAPTSRSPCPGRMTTAFLLLRLLLGDFRYREVPFDQIIDEVQAGTRRGRPADPRGPADLRVARPAQGRRPGRVVAARDRPAAAARRERRAARPRRGRAPAPVDACSRRRSAPGSTTARRRSRTRGAGAAASPRSSPTASSACTSTSCTCDYGDEGREAVRELLTPRRGGRCVRPARPRRVRWRRRSLGGSRGRTAARRRARSGPRSAAATSDLRDKDSAADRGDQQQATG